MMTVLIKVNEDGGSVAVRWPNPDYDITVHTEYGDLAGAVVAWAIRHEFPELAIDITNSAGACLQEEIILIGYPRLHRWMQSPQKYELLKQMARR